MAMAMGDNGTAEICRNGAGHMKKNMEKHLFNPALGRFIRGLSIADDDSVAQDVTVDASLYGSFAFGAFPSDDAMVVSSMQALERHLWVGTDIGGIARYTNDYYHKISHDLESVPGNPWLITTLWLADWYIARGREADLPKAIELLEWAADRAGAGKLLPEQVHPYTGSPLSVCPLTWAHSTYVKVAVDYLKRAEGKYLH
jgi:GH15 family glucan-1,4-alpha-glucosidase